MANIIVAVFDDSEIARMSKALQEANKNYKGGEFNLYAYWRHLAAAALAAAPSTVGQAHQAAAEGDPPGVSGPTADGPASARSAAPEGCEGCAEWRETANALHARVAELEGAGAREATPVDIGYEVDCAMLEHCGQIDAGMSRTITRRLQAALAPAPEPPPHEG